MFFLFSFIFVGDCHCLRSLGSFYILFLTTVAHTFLQSFLIMPSKSTKKAQSLYKIFVDAYMRARPNEKRAVSLLS